MSRTAKAYVGALIAFLSALIAEPDLSDPRAVITAVVAGLVGYTGVWAVPNGEGADHA